MLKRFAALLASSPAVQSITLIAVSLALGAVAFLFMAFCSIWGGY